MARLALVPLEGAAELLRLPALPASEAGSPERWGAWEGG